MSSDETGKEKRAFVRIAGKAEVLKDLSKILSNEELIKLCEIVADVDNNVNIQISDISASCGSF